MHGFTAAIPRGISSRNPALLLQPMQQCNQRWLFNPEVGSDFRLRQSMRRKRKEQESAPLGLAQTHRPESFIELQPPGPCRPVKQWSESLGIEFLHRERGKSLAS